MNPRLEPASSGLKGALRLSPARPTAAGFSLVEVMCAILVLGIGLVGLTQGLSTALASSKDSEIQTAAALLAAGRIETIRAEGYLDDGDTEGDFGDDQPHYSWKQSISQTGIDGLHEVAVTILKTGSDKPVYELRTLLFQPPLGTGESANGKSSTDHNKKRRVRP